MEAADPLNRAIAFLKGKGVLVQAFELSYLRDPDSAPAAVRGRYQACQDRALQLVSTVGVIRSLDTPANDAHSFTREEFPGYDDSIAANPDMLVQIYHSTQSLGYMHAVAVALAYKIKHALADPSAKGAIADVSEIVRSRFMAKQLEEHVFGKDGGPSQNFLRSLLATGSLITATNGEQCGKRLKEHGPALVSQFRVYSDFLDPSTHTHSGEPTGDLVGLHAMVLLGARQDESGRLFFLLQNWWKGKQFVEVDEEYLEVCGGIPFFIKTPQHSLPADVPALEGRWFESTLLDKCDSHPRENM